MKKAFLCKLLMLILCLTLGYIAQAQQPSRHYLFSYFSGIPSDSTGNGQDGLHLAYSQDGFEWKALNNDQSFLKPMVGEQQLMRDPCIARGPDGVFHMVWTTSWEGASIGYASSADLVNWSEQKELSPMAHEPTTRNCWAPELTYNPAHGHFMIYWSSTIPGRYPETDSSNIHGRNHRFYYTLTKDFVTFSPTQLLYDLGFNSIDASIYPDGKRWVVFFKDETRHPEVQKNLKLAFSKALTGLIQRHPHPLPISGLKGQRPYELVEAGAFITTNTPK